MEARSSRNTMGAWLENSSGVWRAPIPDDLKATMEVLDEECEVGCDEAVKGTKARKAPQRKVAPVLGELVYCPASHTR
jgi:hypothetical protein